MLHLIRTRGCCLHLYICLCTERLLKVIIVTRGSTNRRSQGTTLFQVKLYIYHWSSTISLFNFTSLQSNNPVLHRHHHIMTDIADGKAVVRTVFIALVLDLLGKSRLERKRNCDRLTLMLTLASYSFHNAPPSLPSSDSMVSRARNDTLFIQR